MTAKEALATGSNWYVFLVRCLITLALLFAIVRGLVAPLVTPHWVPVTWEDTEGTARSYLNARAVSYVVPYQGGSAIAFQDGAARLRVKEAPDEIAKRVAPAFLP